MCGIIGYIGERQALPILLDGLHRLTYRGYDSAGIAVAGDPLQIERCVGKIENLERALEGKTFPGTIGIGHTRWATHGKPSKENSHPLLDCSGHIAVIHNGIIENYLPLKEELIKRGHIFTSETDTEVLAHLIEDYYAQHKGELDKAVQEALKRVEGQYGIVVMASDEPHKLIAARHYSPLLVGIGKGETFIASDIPALLPYVKDVVSLHDGEIATITVDGVHISRQEHQPIRERLIEMHWKPEMTTKSGYPHYMLKEIHEQPKALGETLSGRLGADGGSRLLEEAKLSPRDIKRCSQITLSACGTSYHAALAAQYMFKELTHLPVRATIASELRYERTLVHPDELFFLVSQSGETADTLAAQREIRSRKGHVYSITNVIGSSVARGGNGVLYTYAGPELAVASTKTFTAQLAILVLLALEVAHVRRTLPDIEREQILEAIGRLPDQMAKVLATTNGEIQNWASEEANQRGCIFLGRGINFPVALEGALKLQEVAYVPSRGLAAGELKHGPLALIDKDLPIIAVATPGVAYDKMLNSMKETKARDGIVRAIAGLGDEQIAGYADYVIYVPRTREILSPILNVIPLQLYAYYMGLIRGADVDQPRHLAKSVTVE